LSLVQVCRLVSVVDNIRRSSGLLEYAELELAPADKVDRLVRRDGLEFGSSGGVVHGYLAVFFISASHSLRVSGADVLRTFCYNPT
jgi:hypothetical protein